jgi:hypothetical protein
MVLLLLAALPVASARASDGYRIQDPDHRNRCLAETP